MYIHFLVPRLLPLSSLIPILRKRHTLLNLRNRQRRIESLGTRSRAVQNRVAPVQAHAVVKRVLALSHLLVSAVCDPAVRLQQNSRAEVLLLIPPVGGAGR